MTENELNNLPYNNSDELSDEIFESTFSSLESLWKKYGYADVLGQLAQTWSFKKSYAFFTKAHLSANNTKPIKTIATFFPCCFYGGAANVQSILMNLWVEMGYNVVLFTELKESEQDFPYPKSVKRYIIPYASNLTKRLSTLQEICVKEHVDLFVNHAEPGKNLMWECILLKMLHIPVVKYIHSTFTLYLHQEIEPLQFCDLVLAIADVNARFFQLFGCHSYIIQNPISQDLTQNTDTSALNSKHILMVGRLSPEKQPIDALNIFKLVHDQIPDAVLDIIGEENKYNPRNYPAQIAAFTAQNHLENSIIYHGWKSPEEIATFYKKSACLIFTSQREAFPMVLLEAKSYGLPIMMYELPYLTMVKDGKGIVAAKQSDIPAMAANIVKLLRDDEYRTETGKQARESFEDFSKYDSKEVWNKIIAYCSPEKKPIEGPLFFDPADVNSTDQLVMSMMLEKYREMNLQPTEAMQQNKTLQQQNTALHQQNNTLRCELQQAKASQQAVYQSTSYRIGNILVKPFHLIKKWKTRS